LLHNRFHQWDHSANHRGAQLPDFDTLDKAIAAEHGDTTAESFVEAPSESTEAPEAEASATELETDAEPSTATTSFSDDTLVTLTVQGKEVQKTLKQLKSEGMMQEDYSRKTAKLAERERQVEATFKQKSGEMDRYIQALETRAQQLQHLIQNPELIERELARRRGTQPQAANRRPDDIVTYADLQKTSEESREAALAEVRRVAAEEAKAVRSEIEEAQFEAKLVDSTDRTLGSIMTENPILQDLPHIESAIKREAAKANPQNIEETIQALVDAGKRIADHYNKKFKNDQKAAVIQQSKLKKQGIEPPGGAAPALPKKTYGKGRHVDWKDLDKDAEAFIRERLGR
jgi:hypothetical protein